LLTTDWYVHPTTQLAEWGYKEWRKCRYAEVDRCVGQTQDDGKELKIGELNSGSPNLCGSPNCCHPRVLLT
jgi:hypothetical protein